MRRRPPKIRASPGKVLSITDSNPRVARLYTATGRVQGVWFRESTRRKAEQLGITGYAKNLANGDVEVLACGSPTALDNFHQWLQSGPPLAKVSEVTERTVEVRAFSTFEIA